jgi:diguanylate cyclase (GGDEF)-like protein/PAS domain S-box-containing protein
VISRYDAVLAALDAGVVVHAADTTILDANERARELLGLVDLEGRPAADPTWVFLEADSSPMPLERFPVMQVRATGQPLHGLTLIIRTPSGTDTWVEVNAMPAMDDSGRLDQVIVTFIDVTQRHVAEYRLAVADEEARVAFEESQVATCIVGNDGRLTRVNRAMCALMDRTAAELESLTFLDVTYPDDRELGADLVADLLAGRRSGFRVTKRYVTGGGRMIWGDVTVSAVRDNHGALRHRIAQILDVTPEHTLRASLMEAERIAHLGAWRYSVETDEATWSPELFAIFGLDPLGGAPNFIDQQRLFTPDSWTRLTAAVAETREFGTPYELELEIVRANGSRGWVEGRGEAVRDASGAIIGLLGSSLDITERKAAQDQLLTLATRDALTGLANRTELFEEIGRAIAASRRSGRSTALLMMDLDRFKVVNDTLGHAAGDELLIGAAARLHEVVRGGDLVARLGGDEFVVVMRDLGDRDEAMAAATRLVDAFRAPFTVSGYELFATASVGVAISRPSSEAGDLVREADTAMYSAKGAGRDRVSSFNEDLRVSIATRMTVEADLRHALERDQLDVWFQPEVDLGTGRVVAFEGLLRWHHPDGQVWSADQFVEIAEETGLILDIGDWVLQRACAAAATWAAHRPDSPPTVRVNVSAVQLAESGLIEAIDAALSASGLDPTLLCVEITETALLQRTAASAANLAAIHARGISLAIDDFGTGYAALTYLHSYPVDVIKIDRSFVSDAHHSDGLVAGIIALASTLGITVTAEGVESIAQASSLLQLGCPSAQGWLYSPAVPADDAERVLDHVYPHP